MLILSRKEGEVIRIGDNIRIRVQRIQEEKVRIGVEAPESIPIHREEIYNKLKEQGRQSTGI